MFTLDNRWSHPLSGKFFHRKFQLQIIVSLRNIMDCLVLVFLELRSVCQTFKSE